MKRITVPVDFSSYSENAFLTALKIAKKANSSITCVNVVASLLDWNNLSRENQNKHQNLLDLEAESKDKLKAFILDHKLEGVPVEPVVEIGIAHKVILDVAEKHASDLIVIGAYGKEYEPGKFIGSNLQTVLRNARCPVLAVKKSMNGNELRKMAFSSLFEEDSKPAFIKMKPLIKAFQTSVHFLFVNTPTQFTTSENAQQKMNLYAKGQEDLVIHKHVYSHREIENGIVEFAKSNKIGFIGIASTNRQGKSSYQVGVTETVLYKTDIPVLSVKIEYKY